MEQGGELLRKCRQVEDFVWPQDGRDWLEETGLIETEPEIYDRLLEFRRLVQRWQSAAVLPVDQVLLALSQDVFTSPVELALAHKLAMILRRAVDMNPSWRLPELTEELAVIARNERRFLGFSEDDTGFDPDQYPGKVVVATIHKAKGSGVGPGLPALSQQLRFPIRRRRGYSISPKSGIRAGRSTCRPKRWPSWRPCRPGAIKSVIMRAKPASVPR